jgi:Ser/Thr protein kinase RdoA (MazF antagonist)
VKPFEQLSHRGKMRRLHQMAVAALPRYNLAGASCTLLNASTNTLFDVRTRNNEQLVLRIATPGWRTLTDLQSEAMWLEALARDTNLRTPRIIRSLDDEAVITMQAKEVPASCHITLTTFLPGMLMGKRLTETNLKKMGALFARLHQHGKAWQPPAGFSSRAFEHFLSRGEPNALIDESPPVIHQAIARVDAEYASLDRADLRVIHCDLWHDNIKVHHGELCPFDFEDTVWGFRLHDIAMAMLDLREVVDDEKYACLLDHFREGYEAELDWPAGNMDALQAGRILWRMNYIKRNYPDYHAMQLDFHCALMQRFLDHDKLIAPLRA